MIGSFVTRAATIAILASLVNACGQPSSPPPPPSEPPGEPPPSSPPPPPPPGTLDPNGKTFTFLDAGNVASPAGGGTSDPTIYLPGMRFPVENAPAYANSQVYAKGGSGGGGGSQCDASNYSYPWRDTFCETRSWAVVLCPSSTGHQGQDIRPPTCDGGVHWAVAAEDGQITAIGSYSVTLVSKAEPQRIYRYLHLKMSTLAVSVGDQLTRGQRIGRVNNDFGGSATTYHLHFDVKTTVSTGEGSLITYVPPYTSLVDAYKRLIAGAP